VTWWNQYEDRLGGSRLRELTAAAGPYVALSVAQSHLRVTDKSENASLDLSMNAAGKWCEGYLGRSLLARQVRQSFDSFPVGNTISLAGAPVFTSTSKPAPIVRYYTEGSTGTVLSSTAYTVDEDPLRPRIVLKRDGEFPSVELRSVNGLEVDYWVGYSTSSSGYPVNLRQAVLMLGAHHFANREAVVVGNVANEVPMSVKSLLMPYRSPYAMV